MSWRNARSDTLAAEKRTRTNNCELRGTNCTYPLRFKQKTTFKQVLASG